MKLTTFEVISNKKLNPTTYEIVFRTEGFLAKSGQFIDLTVKDCYLKRPFSIADYHDGLLTVLYKTVGKGTKEMTFWTKGDKAEALVELGNGFDLSKAERPLLAGGGIGCAPLYLLAKEFCAKGSKPTVLLAFRNAEEAYYIDKFSKIADVILSTDNGCLGYQGNALDCLNYYKPKYDYYYACGPLPMLKAYAAHSCHGQISLEARMGCGFGACMGCSIMTTNGPKRVCKEGPVFEAGEVIF